MNNNNNNNNKNNNDKGQAKVTEEEAGEGPHSSRSPAKASDEVDVLQAGGLWTGKSSYHPSSTPPSLPNWQFSIHKLPNSLPNQDSEVVRPTFSLPGPEARPRMRICFDPEHEIPKLQQWFQLNNHPSRLQVAHISLKSSFSNNLKQSQAISTNLSQSQSISTNLIAKHLLNQVEEYVAILNSLDSRRGKKPLDVNNVIYWFKNTRAAVKRAQVEKTTKYNSF